MAKEGFDYIVVGSGAGGGVVGHVERQDVADMALIAQLLGGVVQLVRVAAVQHQIGTCLGQTLSKGKSDALPRAGDKGAGAGKVKEMWGGHRVILAWVVRGVSPAARR